MRLNTRLLISQYTRCPSPAPPAIWLRAGKWKKNFNQSKLGKEDFSDPYCSYAGVPHFEASSQERENMTALGSGINKIAHSHRPPRICSIHPKLSAHVQVRITAYQISSTEPAWKNPSTMIPQNFLLAFLSLQAQDQGHSPAPQSSQLDLNVFDSVSSVPSNYEVKGFRDVEPARVENHEQQSVISNDEPRIHWFPVSPSFSLLFLFLMMNFILGDFCQLTQKKTLRLVGQIRRRPVQRARPWIPKQRNRTRTDHHKHNLLPLEPSQFIPLHQPRTQQQERHKPVSKIYGNHNQLPKELERGTRHTGIFRPEWVSYRQIRGRNSCQ